MLIIGNIRLTQVQHGFIRWTNFSCHFVYCQRHIWVVWKITWLFWVLWRIWHPRGWIIDVSYWSVLDFSNIWDRSLSDTLMCNYSRRYIRIVIQIRVFNRLWLTSTIWWVILIMICWVVMVCGWRSFKLKLLSLFYIVRYYNRLHCYVWILISYLCIIYAIAIMLKIPIMHHISSRGLSLIHYWLIITSHWLKIICTFIWRCINYLSYLRLLCNSSWCSMRRIVL